MTADPINMDGLVQLLIEKGSAFGIMLLIIHILIKKILEQYEKRIERCEEENAECRADRTRLHDRIESIQQERIDDLTAAIGEE